jgi:hypothetical protein
MVERITVRAVDRAARLTRTAVLAAALAAILFVAYGSVLGVSPAWSAWRLPVGIGAAGGLLLSLAWSFRRTEARATSADQVAAMLGLASAILGVGAALLVATGVTLNYSENRQTIQTFVYGMTSPGTVVSCLMIAAPAAIAGGLGLAIARRRGDAAGRVSAAGAAARFSALGLGCAGVIAAFAAAAMIYRWATWG